MKNTTLYRTLFVLIILMTFVACGGKKEGKCKNGCGPSEPPVCTITFTASPTVFEYTGGQGTATATASLGCVLCAEPAVSDAPWLVISAQNGGNISYDVLAGDSTTDQTGHITKCGRTVTITRKAKPTQACTYTAVPAEDTLDSCKAGEEKTFAIITQPGCTFNPESLSPWLEVIPCTTCNNVRVRAKEDNNTGSTRTGEVKVANGCVIRIHQPSCPVVPECSLQVEGSKEFSCDSQTGTFTFDTNKPWTLSGVTGLLTEVQPTSGDGTGIEKITFKMPSNKASGATTRTVGTFDIIGCNGGQMVFITQKACPAQPPQCVLNASNAGTVSYQGGTFSIPVTSNDPWTASSSNSYVHFTTSTGNGNGTITGTLDPSSSARSATITINGCKTITVNVPQSGPPQCTYTVPPSVEKIAATGTSNGSFSVNTNPNSGCGWSAEVTIGSSWIHLTLASGTGDGPVRFTADPNSAQPDRDGEITVTAQDGTGRKFRVRIPQAGTPVSPCTYTIPPSTETFSSAGTGNGQFSVNTNPNSGCGWTAAVTKGGDWLAITGGSGSGTGDGIVKLFVGGNLSAAREGEVTVTASDGRTWRVAVPQSDH